MNVNKVASSTLFGICVIVASLCSGCASAPYRPPMQAVDLNWFVPDCRIKSQQVAMLQGMRQTKEQQFMASMTNAVTPWRIITSPGSYAHNADQAIGQINWMIDQHLLRLREC